MTVKRSVVLHPLAYKYIQKLRMITLDKGIDLSFSASVNAMIMGQVCITVYGNEEGLKIMWDFILDKKTIEKINRKDLEEQWKEQMRREIKKKLK